MKNDIRKKRNELREKSVKLREIALWTDGNKPIEIRELQDKIYKKWLFYKKMMKAIEKE